MDESYQRSLETQIADHKDFLRGYAEIRTQTASQAYRDGWDGIFGASKAESPPELEANKE